MSLLAAADMPSRKDVVIAEIGATAAFAGLVLVFLGVLVTTYQAVLGSVRKASLEAFKHASGAALAAFIFELVAVTVSVCWLIFGGGETFYGVTLGLFFAQFVGLVAVATYSMRVLLK